MFDPVDVIRAIYGGFDRNDLTPLLESLDSEVEWHEAEHVTFWTGSPFRGSEEVVDGLFRRLPSIFGSSWRMHVERILECGDTVVVQGRYSGRVLATDQELSPQVAHVWDFVDGKITRFQQYTDTWLFAETTGIAPIPTPPAR